MAQFGFSKKDNKLRAIYIHMFHFFFNNYKIRTHSATSKEPTIPPFPRKTPPDTEKHRHTTYKKQGVQLTRHFD